MIELGKLAGGHDKYRRGQSFVAIAMALFLTLLVGAIVLRSADRSSFLGSSASLEDDIERVEGVQAPVQSSSNLHLQDFHRTEVKNGKLAWEVRARDARYFTDEQLAQLSDATITVYRDDGTSVSVSSRAGKLFVNGTSLSRAELEGNIEVLFDSSMKVSAELAHFDAAKEHIFAPGPVKLEGPGYMVAGDDLRVFIAEERLTLARNVTSKFIPGSGARVPRVVHEM